MQKTEVRHFVCWKFHTWVINRRFQLEEVIIMHNREYFKYTLLVKKDSCDPCCHINTNITF
jgi:hypothetical protein